jgi:hypothetical protein
MSRLFGALLLLTLTSPTAAADPAPGADYPRSPTSVLTMDQLKQLAAIVVSRL